MAILRARGGRSLTTCPPIRTSPWLGRSSPAMVRNSVVLPHPEGPRRTRYSPSSVATSTASTAGRSPLSNRFVSWRASTLRPGGGSPRPGPGAAGAASATSPGSADELRLAPLVVDQLDLALRLGHRVLRRLLAPGGPRHHVGDDEGVEDLAHG